VKAKQGKSHMNNTSVLRENLDVKYRTVKGYIKRKNIFIFIKSKSIKYNQRNKNKL